jgi:putative MATE family efflux protein
MSDLLRGPISPALRRLVLPILIGLFVVGAQGAINTYFVARLGSQPLAAMSFAVPLTTLLTSVFIGYGVGVTSTVSRALGARRSHDAAMYARVGLILASAIALSMLLLGLGLGDATFRLLAIDARLLVYVEQYALYWLLGLPLTAVTLAGTAALRGAGETRSSGAILMLCAGLNLCLDPLLIFGCAGWPGLGIAGAGIASSASYAVAALITLRTLRRRTPLLADGIASLGEFVSCARAILGVSAAAIATYVMYPVLNTCVTVLMAKHGTDAVSAYGVAARVQGMFEVVPLAAAAGLAPFVGHNWGAHQHGRVEQALTQTRKFLLLWGMALWLGLAALSGPLAHLFVTDASTFQRLRVAFVWLPVGAASNGMFLAVNASLNAIGKPLSSANLTLLRYIVLGVPLALLLDWAFGVRGLLLCASAAAMLADLVGIRHFTRVMHRIDSAARQPQPREAR